MSKVYSFRLNNDNPREVQAKEVIEAWVGEGYSLRYVIVDALLSYKKAEAGHGELNSVVEQLQDLISTLDKQSGDEKRANFDQTVLPQPFTDAVKNSARSGLGVSK